MSLLLKNEARVEFARSFYRDIYNENDFFYLFASKATAWADEASPDLPIDSNYYAAKYRHDMMFVKRVQAADVVLLCRKIEWVSGTVYDPYDNNYSSANPSYSGATTLADANFYVLTDDNNVYKCLDNNSNAQSTIKPTSTGTEQFELDDGYIWKFMFQIGSADATKFITTNYMPVRKIAGTGQPSFDVNGELDAITVTAGGSGYTSAPTVIIEGDGTGATATATINVSGEVDGVTIDTAGRGYSFALIQFSGGGGTGATATVELGSTETPSLQQAVEATAVSGTIDRIVVQTQGLDYISGDAVVTITGDGTNAAATPIINNAGSITGITVTDPGQDYTFADITITQTVGGGTSFTGRAIIAPYSGHGGNAPKELFAKNLGLTVSFISDDKDIIVGNEYRQIGLIKNIQNYAETALYTSSIATPCFVVTVSTPDDWNLDDELTTSDGGKFRVIQKLDLDSDGTIETVYLQEILPNITSGSIFENLTTGTSGIAINTVTNPEISNHSGEIVYIDNRRPITRDEKQVETIKIIINF